MGRRAELHFCVQGQRVSWTNSTSELDLPVSGVQRWFGHVYLCFCWKPVQQKPCLTRLQAAHD